MPYSLMLCSGGSRLIASANQKAPGGPRTSRGSSSINLPIAMTNKYRVNHGVSICRAREA
ncbi:hypothetical protein ColLi_10591 [Colletotrichum liriopes]|uniref:Uncharacterized protein n=1 Tax=Colletotrichum liriopes TaxID=708192 RepID=A0AA37GUY7_9PEZI|nr:hypothetical protein ColLi_10591 [Colletotrichum liriopes]